MATSSNQRRASIRCDECVLGERGASIVLLPEHHRSGGPRLDLSQGRDRDRRTPRHYHPHLSGPDTTPVCTDKGSAQPMGDGAC